MTQRKMQRLCFGMLAVCAAAVAVMLATPSYAVIEDTPSSRTSGDVELLAAEGLVKERRFEEAMPLLMRVIARDPGSADAYNYLAFSQRKLGRLEEAFTNYMRALDLDPDHIGAREYLGELYLQLGQREKAEEQLSRLMVLCPLGCEAREDLARAIAESKRLRSP